ncbi:MAG: sulfotransferase family protein [Candidatus Heimdallarchaeota archaeon]
MNEKKNDQGFVKRVVRYAKRFEKANRYTKSTFQDLQYFLLFIGTPRAGTTLVGSLLDAHFNVIISNELNITNSYLDYYKFNKRKIYSSILSHSVDMAKKKIREEEREKHHYDYNVMGQGRFSKLLVIGDKKAMKTSEDLFNRPELLQKIREAFPPLKFLHVIRNPYDNIISMIKHFDLTREQAIDKYLKLNEITEELKKQFDQNECLVVYYEKLLENPEVELVKIMSFLELELTEPYLESCKRKLFRKPIIRRFDYEWKEEELEKIKANLEEKYSDLYAYYDLNDVFEKKKVM